MSGQFMNQYDFQREERTVSLKRIEKNTIKKQLGNIKTILLKSTKWFNWIAVQYDRLEMLC